MPLSDLWPDWLSSIKEIKAFLSEGGILVVLSFLLFAWFIIKLWLPGRKKTETPEIHPMQSVYDENKALVLGTFPSRKGVYFGAQCIIPQFEPPDAPLGLSKAAIYYDGDRHMLTFGPTGSGKGATSQIPALLDQSAPCSALVIDVKGQLAAVTGKARCIAGQEVRAINPFNVLDIPTATYNPLRFIDPNALDFQTQCKKIAEGLGFEQAEKSDDKNAFFEITALDLVNLLIQWAVLYAGKTRFEEYAPNLISVRKVLSLASSERIAFFETLTKADNPAIAEGAQMFTSDRGAIEDCVSTARGKLSFLRDAGIERVLQGGGENEISFAELKRQLMTVYLIIPPELLNTHGRFLRLLVMSALGELFKELATPENPVLFMLDEFAQLGHMALIENVASVGRDYKIRLWPILQNLPQLKTLYGNKWESFLSAAGMVQFFAPNDLETATYISKRAGQKVVMRRSTSTSTGMSAGGSSSNRSESFSETYEPRLKIEELFALHETKQIVFSPNVSEGMILSRFRYYKHYLFSTRRGVEADPYHMTPEARAAFCASMKTGCFNPAMSEEVRAKEHSSAGENAYRDQVAAAIVAGG